MNTMTKHFEPNDNFDYTEIDKKIKRHRELSRDLFVAPVGRLGPTCFNDASPLAEMAMVMAEAFDDAYDENQAYSWNLGRIEEYLARLSPGYTLPIES